MTAAELLRAAAGIYESAPDHTKSGFPPVGTYCALYALDAARDTKDRTSVYYSADRALREVAGESIVDWNAENTTEDVVAGFHKAAAICEIGVY